MTTNRDEEITKHFLPDDLIEEKKKLIEEWANYIKIGDIYLDAFGHPTLCTKVTIEFLDIGLQGISLFDGTYPRGCGLIAQNIEKVSIDEAWEMKLAYEKAKDSNGYKQ